MRKDIDIVRSVTAALMNKLDRKYFDHEKKCMDFLDGYESAIADLGRIDLGEIAEKELYPKDESDGMV